MKKILSIFLYSVVIAVAISTANIFRPFTFIDNTQSNIECSNDKHVYETTPNYIFAISDRLDSSNDAKARKLCELHIIRDYNNTYETPKNKNYTFLPTKNQESSWINTIFAASVVLLMGMTIIKLVTQIPFQSLFLKNNFLYLFVCAVSISGVYLLLLQKPASILYCKKMVYTRLYNFDQAILRNGAPEKIEHNEFVANEVHAMYQQCLLNEGILP